jgi:RsiW-degrading membrane proteinase PrsW (M82 family)
VSPASKHGVGIICREALAGLSFLSGSIRGKTLLLRDAFLSSEMPSFELRALTAADARLIMVGVATVVVALAAFVAGQMGALSGTAATVIVMVGMGIFLRVTWMYMACSSSSAARLRMTSIISSVGLAISALTVLAALPRLTKAAGTERMVLDFAAQLWTIALLTAAAAPVRTLGWRAFTGAFLTGFLGLTALARFVGRPLVVKYGLSSLPAVGVWVPLTEEICKMLPILLILGLALRRSESRPSLMDLVLLAAWTGAGFAVYENVTFGRGGFSLSVNGVLSWFFPSSGKGMALGWSVVQTGHLLHTALITLGVGFGCLYRNRVRDPLIIPTVAIVSVLLEHMSQNSIATGALNDIMGEAAIVLSLGGRLCAVLLIVGVGYVAVMEWHAVPRPMNLKQWLRLEAGAAAQRSRSMAALQRSRGAAR